MSETSEIQYLYRKEKFWLENPASLFNSVNPFPDRGMTKNQRLNALTRFILLVTLFLIIADFKHWAFFLLISLFVIIIIYVFTSPEDSINLIENYTCRNEVNKKNRHVTFLPDPEIRIFSEYQEDTNEKEQEVEDSGFIAYD